MDNNIVSMCLQFLIILPSFSKLPSAGLNSATLSIAVVSALCLTSSSADSSKIKINLWIVI